MCHKSNSRRFFVLNIFIAAVFTLFLTGCGGGGGSGGTTTSGTTPQSISGLAAMGGPMSYASITVKSVKDSTSKTYTALSDGTFTVQPGVVTYPAVVTAVSQNGQYTHYGYIDSDTQATVAVNPITTMQLTFASQADPSTLMTPLSTTQINNGQAESLTVLNNVVTSVSGVNTTQSFLTQNFPTNHTGSDEVLDNVAIAMQPTGKLTVANKISGTMDTIDPTSTSVTALPFTSTDITNNQPAITACSTFLGGLTSSTIVNSGNFDAGFLDAGMNQAAYSTYIGQITSLAGASFNITNPVFKGLDGNGNYLFGVTLANSTNPKAAISDLDITTKVVSNQCVMVGDQFPWEITIQPAIKQVLREDGTTSNQISPPVSGIEVQVAADNTNNTYQGSPFLSARADVCSAANVCNLLSTLSMSTSGQLTVDAGTNVYPNVNLVPNPAFDILSDNLNAVRITFFSTATAPTTGSTGQVGTPLTTRSSAAAFTNAEFTNIAANMPSITNVAQVLQNTVANPTLNFNSGGTSTVVSTVGFYSANSGYTLTNSGSALILNSGIFSSNTQFTDVASPYYKYLDLSAHINGRPGMIETKYVWAPTCVGCY